MGHKSRVASILEWLFGHERSPVCAEYNPRHKVQYSSQPKIRVERWAQVARFCINNPSNPVEERIHPVQNLEKSWHSSKNLLHQKQSSCCERKEWFWKCFYLKRNLTGWLCYLCLNYFQDLARNGLLLHSHSHPHGQRRDSDSDLQLVERIPDE